MHAVLLRNTGLLLATARVAMAPHNAFELLGGERHVALAPGETQAVSVAFRPATAGRHTHQARILYFPSKNCASCVSPVERNVRK